MTRAIRSSNISTKGGTFAAIFFVAVFASVQVACLTHTHCAGTDCFEHQEESHEHEADHECGHAHGSSCEDEHHDHDIHHHSHDGKTHPKRRFTAPVVEAVLADTASSETPVFEMASYLTAIDELPPFERYGLDFAERAPPLS